MLCYTFCIRRLLLLLGLQTVEAWAALLLSILGFLAFQLGNRKSDRYGYRYKSDAGC